MTVNSNDDFPFGLPQGRVQARSYNFSGIVDYLDPAVLLLKVPDDLSGGIL